MKACTARVLMHQWRCQSYITAFIHTYNNYKGESIFTYILQTQKVGRLINDQLLLKTIDAKSSSLKCLLTTTK